MDIILTDSCVSLSFSIEKVKKKKNQKGTTAENSLKIASLYFFFFFFWFSIFVFVFNVKNRKESSLRSWHEEKEPFAAAYTEGAVRRVMDPLRPEPQDHARLLGHSYQACKQVLTISGKFSYYCCSVAKSL